MSFENFVHTVNTNRKFVRVIKTVYQVLLISRRNFSLILVILVVILIIGKSIFLRENIKIYFGYVFINFLLQILDDIV